MCGWFKGLKSLKENKSSECDWPENVKEKTNFHFNFILVMELLGFHLTYRFFSFQDVDLFARSHFNENDANNFTTRSKRTFYAATASQLNCTASYDLENVQGCGRAGVIDVSAQRKYTNIHPIKQPPQTI